MSDAIREAFARLANRLHELDDSESLMRDCDAVKAALQSSQTAPAVPDGWMLVPVEPTGDMQEAGAKEIRFNTTAINKLWTGNRVYGAMLAAAPQPDHSPDAGKVNDECRRILDRLNSSDPDFNDCADAAALIVRLQSELSGPDGFATWKDAALHERKMRLSTDAGKVVGDHYDLGVALSRHFDELRDSETGRIAFDPCDSNDIDEVLAIINSHLSPAPATNGGEVEVNRAANAILEAWKKAEPDHSITKNPISYIATFADMARAAIAATRPAESREEIQALEAFAHDCGLFDSAYDDQEYIEIPRWRFREYIDRLRASQQEGGEG